MVVFFGERDVSKVTSCRRLFFPLQGDTPCQEAYTTLRKTRSRLKGNAHPQTLLPWDTPLG
jgi:hypothetical protein